jgi:hypothetical protein
MHKEDFYIPASRLDKESPDPEIMLQALFLKQQDLEIYLPYIYLE